MMFDNRMKGLCQCYDLEESKMFAEIKTLWNDSRGQIGNLTGFAYILKLSLAIPSNWINDVRHRAGSRTRCSGQLVFQDTNLAKDLKFRTRMLSIIIPLQTPQSLQ